MKPPYALIDGYFEGMLSDEQFAELVDWLHASPDHARAFARWAQLRRQITEHMQGEDIATVMLDEVAQPGDPLDLHGPSLHGANFAEVLTRLDVKGDSEVELVDLSAQLQAAARQTREAYRADRREARQQAMQYLAGVGKDLATSPWLYAGLAAMLALAAATWALLPAGSPPPAPTAERGTQTDRSAPERPTPVATLTQTHDAQWAAFKLSAGDALYARQRLTLTQGFAEITTDSGAVAILEAPATIELTDSDNALQLHDGRLVGICESESSKGFTVYTPTARIIDLGTRFGTEVGKDKSTRTAVFDGEIELAARNGLSDQPARSVRLTAGWSSGVSTRGVLDREPQPLNARDHNRFAHRIEDGMSPRFAYRRAVLSADPLLYWSFDEADEQTSNLAGSDAFDGRAMGQTSYAKGLFGSALQLTGDIKSMGGFTSKSPMDFNEVGAYTLEAWCWIEQPHYGRVLALAELGPDQTQPPMHLSMVEVIGGEMLSNIARPHRNSVRFLHRNPPSFESEEGSNWFTDQAPPAGQWLHMVVVKDDQEARIYINGALALSSKDTQPTATESPVSLFVGVSPIMLRTGLSSNPRDFRPFHGLIDEVAVYDTALATRTIQHHFSLGRISDGG